MFNRRKIMIVITALVILTQMLGNSVAAQAAEENRSPFVPDAIYFHNEKYADRTVVHGIDVSRYQYDIDWEKVKEAGVQFAFIRAGYRGYGAAGGMGADPYFIQNMEGAVLAGIPVGVYFFSQATTVEEAIEEAEYTLNKIAGYPVTMPVVFDFEYASVNGKAGGRLYDAKLSKREATDVCMAFCETIEAAGYEAMVYANTVMLNNNVYADEISSKYKIWLANYTSMTAYTGEYDYWQYTSSGTVSGIEGRVDCNFWYQRPGEEITEVPSLPSNPTVEIKPVEQITGVRSTERTDSQIHLVWEPVTDASGYEVYRYNESNGVYDLVGTVSTPSISTCTDTGLMAGTTYDYVVRGYRRESNGQIAYGEYSERFAASTAPKMVTGLCGGSRTTSKIRLNWDWTEEVTGYRIYRYNTKTKQYEKVKTLDSAITTWVDSKLEPGKSYDYAIRTYIKDDYGTYWGDMSQPVTVRTKPSKVEGFAMTVARKDKVRLGWAKTEGADGYLIYRYDSKTKKYEPVKDIQSADTTTWVNSKLKANTTYQYKIKAYIKESDGMVYTGAASGIVTAKTKK